MTLSPPGSQEEGPRASSASPEQLAALSDAARETYSVVLEGHASVLVPPDPRGERAGVV